MTKGEFGKISHLLKNGWPGQYGKDNVAAYAEFLLPFEFEAVRDALHKLAGEGQKFVPSVGLVLAAVRSLSEPVRPAWADAWTQIEQAMVADAAGRTVEMHPLVAAFTDREGLARLRRLPFYDPEYGELRIRDLGQRFSDFCDAQDARSAQRFAIGPDRQHALERGALALPAAI